MVPVSGLSDRSTVLTNLCLMFSRLSHTLAALDMVLKNSAASTSPTHDVVGVGFLRAL